MVLTPTTRASLLLRLRDSQDHAAWVEFLALYEPVVYRLLRRHGLQDADAREVMQDLFLAVSRSIGNWDPSPERGSFRGWLRRVVRNLVINWLKAPARRHIAVGGAAGGPELQALLENVPADAGAETQEFEHELRRARFHRAAALVRDEVQQTTWQAFWETAVVGNAPTDVGARLGMSVGAVRVAKCRVLARLQAAVRAMEDER